MSELRLKLHKRQSDAFLSRATEILYGGAAGGGKSHLMRVVALMLCMAVAGLQVYLFRRVSDDLRKNHLEGVSGLRSMLAPLMQSGHVKFNDSKGIFEFWNGAKIYLCHCQHEKDMYKYQGAEIHVLLMDVSTHSHPKVAASDLGYDAEDIVFQHTATRRWLQPEDADLTIPKGFNTQPPEGGCLIGQQLKIKVTVSTHSHPKVAAQAAR